MNIARIYAVVFGAVYTLVGIVGSFVAPTLAVRLLTELTCTSEIGP